MSIERKQRFRFARRAALTAAAVALVLGAGVSAPRAEEGYDLMRQITTQWVNPFLVIVFDKSGSMKWTIDESDGTWNFDFSNEIDGYVYSRDDATEGYPDEGRGQGFWMRVDEMEQLSKPPTTFVYDNFRSFSGWIDHDYTDNIYHPGTEPALYQGDLIRVVDHPVAAANGIYMVRDDSTASGHNSGWWYTKFYKMNPDGTFSGSTYDFPLDNGSDVTDFTFERVRLRTDPGTMTAEGWQPAAGHDARRDWLYVWENFDLQPGDIIRATGFDDPSENTFYMVRYKGGDSGWYPDYSYYAVSRMNAQGEFPNEQCQFVDTDDGFDWNVRVQIYRLQGEPITLWYFVPASRMAIAKNVWGDSVTLHQPSVAPSGYDDDGKPYYIFEGPGPVNGAWKEWTDDGDNGHGGDWHNWSANSTNTEPIGDPDFTEAVPPADMIAQFADVANLGLVEYSGGCYTFSPTVAIETDDENQSGVIDDLHDEFELRDHGGVGSGGSTPTRGGLAGAGEALSTAFNNDPKAICGRTYGVILLTDGQSNACNPGCWKDPWTENCDGTDPGYYCPYNWTEFPAGIADELWNLTLDGIDLHVRTWPIGISSGIGPCELNYTAYKGRTDANSPLGDGGHNISADPYITADDSDVFDDEVLDPTADNDGDGDVSAGHGPYAYFANSIDELRRALAEILASLGAGDYTTSAPSVSGSAQVGANMAFLPSSKYPGWKGHLRGFQQQYNTSTGQLEWVEAWDAGEVLGASSDAHPNNDQPRALYTWDPANDNALVQITSANAGTLDGLCGNCGVDSDVVSFIRGESVNGHAREWRLGALINSTPAVIGPPETWEQTVEGHEDFEEEYAGRHTMVWVGSSDGMIHAIDPVDGAEIIGLLPPNRLDEQVELFEQWSINPAKYPTGQPSHPADHIHGVANSVRFADIWDDDESMFRTVVFVPEGPGGSGIHAIDVTHPYPGRNLSSDVFTADVNYDSAAPVDVLWSRTEDGEAGTVATAGLGRETWSLPAVAIEDVSNQGEPTSVVLLGSGYADNESNATNPPVWFLDPLTGDIVQDYALENANTYLVGNQAFADNVIFETDAKYYRPDNIVDEGLQADLNGVLWSFSGNNWNSDDRLFDLGGENPMYYSPAVSGYPATEPAWDLYAFSTGSFYETSELITGSQATFEPSLVLGTKSLTTGDTDYVEIAITDVPLPASSGGVTTGTLSDRAQVIAPPLLLTPAAGVADDPFALYLVYDPLGGVCVGKSYIVWVNFNPENLSDTTSNLGDMIDTYEAGEGAAGGFALAGERVIISQSAVGENAEAQLVEVPNLTIPPGNPGRNVSWWIEHQ